MKIELSKADIEQAVEAYIGLWFPELSVTAIEFIRTKKVSDLKIVIETKKEGDR